MSYTNEEPEEMKEQGFACAPCDFCNVYYPVEEVVFGEKPEISYKVYPWISSTELSDIFPRSEEGSESGLAGGNGLQGIESEIQTSLEPVDAGLQLVGGELQMDDKELQPALQSVDGGLQSGLQKIEDDDQQEAESNYAYIVKCSDNTFYTGWTNNLEKRIKAHNSGKGAKYTKTRLPVKLVYYEEFDTKQEAMSREWHIKQLSRQEKEKLIETKCERER